MDNATVQLEANRVDAQTNGRTPDWLRTETEDRQYQILAEMISGELEQIKRKSRPQRVSPSPIPWSPLQSRQYPKVFP